MRPRIIIQQATSSLVISVRGKIVLAREDVTITRQIIEKQQAKKAYDKRHDEFIAIGGTRELSTYSDNVLYQIELFLQQRIIH